MPLFYEGICEHTCSTPHLTHNPHQEQPSAVDAWPASAVAVVYCVLCRHHLGRFPYHRLCLGEKEHLWVSHTWVDQLAFDQSIIGSWCFDSTYMYHIDKCHPHCHLFFYFLSFTADATLAAAKSPLWSLTRRRFASCRRALQAPSAQVCWWNWNGPLNPSSAYLCIFVLLTVSCLSLILLCCCCSSWWEIVCVRHLQQCECGKSVGCDAPCHRPAQNGTCVHSFNKIETSLLNWILTLSRLHRPAQPGHVLHLPGRACGGRSPHCPALQARYVIKWSVCFFVRGFEWSFLVYLSFPFQLFWN